MERDMEGENVERAMSTDCPGGAVVATPFGRPQ
jgi:hypothetical protein